jgi:hypothetical protein
LELKYRVNKPNNVRTIEKRKKLQVNPKKKNKQTKNKKIPKRKTHFEGEMRGCSCNLHNAVARDRYEVLG